MEIIRKLCKKIKSLRLVLPCATWCEKMLKIFCGYSRLRLVHEETDNEVD